MEIIRVGPRAVRKFCCTNSGSIDLPKFAELNSLARANPILKINSS